MNIVFKLHFLDFSSVFWLSPSFIPSNLLNFAQTRFSKTSLSMHIYVSCGVWISSVQNQWSFIADEKKRGRLVSLQSTTTFDELKEMVSEDYGESNVDLEFSYLPSELINNVEVPPVIITNNRQLQNFIAYAKKSSSVLCVTFNNSVDNGRRINIDLNKEPPLEEVGSAEENHEVKLTLVESVCGDGGSTSGMKDDSQNKSRLELVKKGQIFRSKGVLKATLEIYAMKYNFDYKVEKSDPTKWYVHCKDKICKWCVCATRLDGASTYFIINKYVAEHTCAPSKRINFSKTASAKTIGNLIMHTFEGVKDGPKPNDIVHFMRKEYGCELSYSHAWESREYAIAAVRGIPEKSYNKIPKYLHMLREANPGTHTHFTTDSDGRFKYLFLSFGQSLRGFYNNIRRVIVIDGTFLKSKYKGVLLVATAVDGNSNLYPIAFGVVDSENDKSWMWFLEQLKVVIADDPGLAFVSDRNASITKSLASVYPQARHGICIHHLLNNVVTYFKKRGMVALIEKASKAYRVVDFETAFTEICSMCPSIGKYLQEADITKWARCKFPGYRYDIRTTNPAESINAALRSPREYPVIPLLDSIREMLTRWFYERRTLSLKQKDPLTITVEKKVDRRIEKAKGFIVYPTDTYRFLVKGDKFDCFVDLARRICTCGKYDLSKIPCRHAIPAIFSIGMEVYRFTDEMYTTTSWIKAYEECINPVTVPEDEWHISIGDEDKRVQPPETRRSAGRRRKRRYESVGDIIRSSQSQGSHNSKKRKCSRCGNENHNRATCDMPI